MPFAEPLTCKIEPGILYKGGPETNINSNSNDKRSDELTCRSYCKSLGAKYFVWHTLSYDTPNKQGKCLCKSSTRGSDDQQGVISGDVCNNGKMNAENFFSRSALLHYLL